jgi:hypothetical protein
MTSRSSANKKSSENAVPARDGKDLQSQVPPVEQFAPGQHRHFDRIFQNSSQRLLDFINLIKEPHQAPEKVLGKISNLRAYVPSKSYFKYREKLRQRLSRTIHLEDANTVMTYGPQKTAFYFKRSDLQVAADEVGDIMIDPACPKIEGIPGDLDNWIPIPNQTIKLSITTEKRVHDLTCALALCLEEGLYPEDIIDGALPALAIGETKSILIKAQKSSLGWCGSVTVDLARVEQAQDFHWNLPGGKVPHSQIYEMYRPKS